MLYDQFMAE